MPFSVIPITTSSSGLKFVPTFRFLSNVSSRLLVSTTHSILELLPILGSRSSPTKVACAPSALSTFWRQERVLEAIGSLHSILEPTFDPHE